MDQKKLDFIKNFESEKKPDNPKDAMAFLITYLNQAKNNNISFTKDEINLIADELTKDLPPEKKEQIHKIIKMLN